MDDKNTTIYLQLQKYLPWHKVYDKRGNSKGKHHKWFIKIKNISNQKWLRNKGIRQLKHFSKY